MLESSYRAEELPGNGNFEGDNRGMQWGGGGEINVKAPNGLLCWGGIVGCSAWVGECLLVAQYVTYLEEKKGV